MPALDVLFTTVENYDKINIQYLSVSLTFSLPSYLPKCPILSDLLRNPKVFPVVRSFLLYTLNIFYLTLFYVLDSY